MTWREKTVVRILLLVARIIARQIDASVDQEIQHLANHIGASKTTELAEV